MGFWEQLESTYQHFRMRGESGADDYVQPARALARMSQHYAGAADSRQAKLWSIGNDENCIVLRTSGTSGAAKLNTHPLSFHERVVACGRTAIEELGIRGREHACLLAIPVGRLSGGFIFCYEVIRQLGWTILPVGTTNDPSDVSQLIEQFGVDVVIMLPNLIEATFVDEFREQLKTVQHVLFLGEMLHEKLASRLCTNFPNIDFSPLLYSSNDTGPIGYPCRSLPRNTYRVFDHIVLEVSQDGEHFNFTGEGELYVSVLMRSSPGLIRYRIGDAGELSADRNGRRTVRLAGRANSSIKFQMDRAGSSFIVERDQILRWVGEATGSEIAAEFVQFGVDARTERTALDFMLSDDAKLSEIEHITAQLKQVCPPQWRDRICVRVASRREFFRAPSGKVPFFYHLRE